MVFDVDFIKAGLALNPVFADFEDESLANSKKADDLTSVVSKTVLQKVSR